MTNTAYIRDYSEILCDKGLGRVSTIYKITSSKLAKIQEHEVIPNVSPIEEPCALKSVGGYNSQITQVGGHVTMQRLFIEQCA